MSNVVIQVEQLSKYYRLGQIGGKRLVDDLNRWWARIRGQEDPLSKVGLMSNHSSAAGKNGTSNRSREEAIWALKGVSFEVKQGEVLGIIGRNGAGKSTLLKILSRVTAPTSGEVRVKGRIASLLEVGTGFHPELTGRENIFLNGAILGMTKAEIRAKFDEIVAFAGTEAFIDTPVKRYSSGMNVRLAFAVAAHLEPEILIVDEVLAVGDVAFQTKCLGKMRDVTKQGRTILFVSHNMAAMRSLCTQAILMNSGHLVSIGETEGQVAAYYNLCERVPTGSDSIKLSAKITLVSLTLEPNPLDCGGALRFGITFKASSDSYIYQCVLLLCSSQGVRIGIVELVPEHRYHIAKDAVITIHGQIEDVYLVEGKYNVGLFLNADGFKGDLLDVAQLNVSGQPNFRTQSPISAASRGFIEFKSNLRVLEEHS